MASGNIFDAKSGGLVSGGLAAFFNPPPKTPDEEYRYYLCFKDEQGLRPTYFCKRDTYENVLKEHGSLFVDNRSIVAISRTLPAFLDQPRIAWRLDASVSLFRSSK